MKLYSPHQLGMVELKNRVVMAPMPREMTLSCEPVGE
jgi:2,4-dienoyl-CoA reductase-like NADH-dependent reductase (Old Yellow Enzyme family)